MVEVQEEEIKEVIWHMKEGKALGPDGFTVTFLSMLRILWAAM